MPRAFLYNIEALTNAINRDNATLDLCGISNIN